jgi:hypothetical protein
MDNLDKIKKFIELRSSGLTLRDIAKTLNRSLTTIVKWNKQYSSITFEVQSEELKEFKQKLLEEKKSRLNYLNNNFIKIRDRLENSEIILRYDKMLVMLMKLSKSIDECQRNLVLTEVTENFNKIDENSVADEIENSEKPEKHKENPQMEQN